MSTSIESPLIGSGSQEEVDLRVAALIDLGKSRGYLTYDELNERLPDEVVSPDKLDTLLMMIDEMGIKLIDELDIAEYQQKTTTKNPITGTDMLELPTAKNKKSKDGGGSVSPSQVTDIVKQVTDTIKRSNPALKLK